MPNIVALNGSIRGADGNTARLLQHARGCVGDRAQWYPVTLATCDWDMARLHSTLEQADAVLLASGVYWNNYGSPVQRFLEVITAWETTDACMGKPAAVLLSMDSVGGTDIGARLLGALNLMGFWTPPLSTVVLARASMQAADSQDVYGLDDVRVLMDNLCLAAAQPRPAWRRWPVKSAVQPTGRYAAPGALQVDLPPWLAP